MGAIFVDTDQAARILRTNRQGVSARADTYELRRLHFDPSRAGGTRTFYLRRDVEALAKRVGKSRDKC